MKQKNVFCSWSGGHDCCLGLFTAQKKTNLKLLITPLLERGPLYRTPGLSYPSLLRAQADLIQIPLFLFNASFENWEKTYEENLALLKKYDLHMGVFSCITNERQKNLYEELCSHQNIETSFPLWEKDQDSIFSQFLEEGFKAKIISVNEKMLSREFLGKDLDAEIGKELKQKKIGLFGEHGEYHTVVYDAPFFKEKLLLKEGDITLKNNYWTLDFFFTPPLGPPSEVP